VHILLFSLLENNHAFKFYCHGTLLVSCLFCFSPLLVFVFFFVRGRGASVKGYEKRAGMRFSARGGAHGLMALALV